MERVFMVVGDGIDNRASTSENGGDDEEGADTAATARQDDIIATLQGNIVVFFIFYSVEGILFLLTTGTWVSWLSVAAQLAFVCGGIFTRNRATSIYYGVAACALYFMFLSQWGEIDGMRHMRGSVVSDWATILAALLSMISLILFLSHIVSLRELSHMRNVASIPRLVSMRLRSLRDIGETVDYMRRSSQPAEV